MHLHGSNANVSPRLTLPQICLFDPIHLSDIEIRQFVRKLTIVGLFFSVASDISYSARVPIDPRYSILASLFHIVSSHIHFGTHLANSPSSFHILLLCVSSPVLIVCSAQISFTCPSWGLQSFPAHLLSLPQLVFAISDVWPCELNLNKSYN